MMKSITSTRQETTHEERSPGGLPWDRRSASCADMADIIPNQSGLPELPTLTVPAYAIQSRLTTTARTKVAFVDLDHTISDAFWRDYLIKDVMTELDWAYYHQQSCLDNPIRENCELVRALFAYDYEIIILTSRHEACRVPTIAWLHKHNIPFHCVIMRPTGNSESAAPLKLRQAKEYLDATTEDKTVFIIDDNEAVCATFCEAGASVLKAQIHRRKDYRKFAPKG